MVKKATSHRTGANSTGSRPSSGLISAGSKRWPWVVVIVLIVIAAAIWFFRAPIQGYAGAGAGYTARVACSCRFVSGRDLDDCAKDKLAGMELISLKEDVEAKSVTARFPLVKSETATFKEGYGCVLESWPD